ncbi:MAG: SRPBCC domain-containing protein [Bdellovibrionota bacterium]
MEPKFSVATRIDKPLAEVFDAVVNPKKITGYFCDQADAPLVEGQTVHWTWTAHKVTHPVKVKQIVPNSKIVIEWPSMSGGTTIAEMSFSTLDDGRTMVKISESGWPATEEGVKASYKNCEGWQHMISCMKAYLQHGIDLRK